MQYSAHEFCALAVSRLTPSLTWTSVLPGRTQLANLLDVVEVLADLELRILRPLAVPPASVRSKCSTNRPLSVRVSTPPQPTPAQTCHPQSVVRRAAPDSQPTAPSAPSTERSAASALPCEASPALRRGRSFSTGPCMTMPLIDQGRIRVQYHAIRNTHKPAVRICEHPPHPANE